jgi:hypothetical protein
MADEIKVVKRPGGKTPDEVQNLTTERTPAPYFQSIYANNAQISTSYFDIRMRLGEVTGVLPDRIPVLDKVEIVMSPEHAASLYRLLGQQIEIYRQSFGEIRIEPTAPVEPTDKTPKSS